MNCFLAQFADVNKDNIIIAGSKENSFIALIKFKQVGIFLPEIA